jgi:hypothetical protein
VKRHTRRAGKFVIGAALTALVAITAQASAHVTVGIPTLSVTTVVFRSPVEPAPTTLAELAAHHTQELSVSYPAGFKVEKCIETADFTCTFGVDQITWTRRAGSTNFGLVTINGAPVVNPTTGAMSAAEFFEAEVRTPGIGGTSLTPALQVYSDGEEVSWSDPNTTDPHPAPQLRVNGPDRAPAVATGVFKPLSELGAGNPCPQTVIDEAIRLGLDPAVHCGHFGFEPPTGSPAPPSPPAPPADELDIRGTAKLVRTADQTWLVVRVTGLVPGQVYSAHLHEGTCGDPTSAHYKNDPAGPDGPPNELWPSTDQTDPTFGLLAKSNGVARGFGKADWVARPTARAVWIHQPEDPAAPPGSHVHARIACANLV